MKGIGHVVVAAVVLAGTGLLHGLRVDRWKISNEPEASAARLDGIPMSIGDWDGEALEVEPKQFALAGAVGHVVRVYRDRVRGTELTLAITCGRPGPIAVHTPEVCYGGAGFGAASPEIAYAAPYQTHSGVSQSGGLHVRKFRKDQSGIPSSLRIFWSWSATGTWEVPNNPRVSFARYPALYKLYVIRPLSTEDDDLDADPACDFIRLLLGQLNQVLFDGSSTAENPILAGGNTDAP